LSSAGSGNTCSSRMPDAARICCVSFGTNVRISVFSRSGSTLARASFRASMSHVFRAPTSNWWNLTCRAADGAVILGRLVLVTRDEPVQPTFRDFEVLGVEFHADESPLHRHGHKSGCS